MVYLPHCKTCGFFGIQQPVAACQTCFDPGACKMKVEGKGTLQVQPDVAVAILGASTESKQLLTAQKENTEIMTKVINTLKGMGIPSVNIQTQSYSVEPRYDYIEGKQILRGYQVLHTLRVTVENVDRVGEIIDAAVDAGANLVSSISFTLKDPSRYYRQALDMAIEDTVAKAWAISQKLQIHLQPTPMQLIEKRNECAIPFKPVLISAAQAVTPIQAGQLEIVAEIEAIFGYYNKRL